MKKEVKTEKAPSPVGPYAQAIEAGNFVFLAGQIGIVPETGHLPSSIQEQTKQVLTNIHNILKSINLSMKNVVKTTVFLKNLEDFLKVNEIYAAFFEPPFPARSTVEVSSLPKGALIEIEAIAIKY